MSLLIAAVFAFGGAPMSDEIRAIREAGGAIRKRSETRFIAPGARPAILLEGAALTFEGRELALGGPVAGWKKVIGGAPACRRSAGGGDICVWDALGLRVETDPARLAVRAFTLYFAVPAAAGAASSAALRVDPADVAPARPFGGYFALDGFGIDAKAKFWEMRDNAGGERALRCGILDCTRPAGRFGPDAMFLQLDGRDETGTIKQLTLASASR